MWKEIEKMKDIKGFENWNKEGSFAYHGFRPKFIGDDMVHDVQVIQPKGVVEQKQEVLPNGDILYRVGKDRQDRIGLYDADFVHEVVYDCFVGASVTKTAYKEKKVRVGNGYGIKKIAVEKTVPGYKYAKVQIVDTWVERETGDTLYLATPVSAEQGVS